MQRVLRFHKVLGIVFIVLMLVGVWLVYAIFSKKFADYDRVTLESSSVGLNLPARADVKVRGLIVGEVLDTKTTGDGAELTLGFFPGQIDKLPENVTGLIVPKTLFGEKYVSLQMPSDAEGTLTTSDTIEKTEVSTEIEAVLNDLFPLLRTVQPGELNMTLNAVATALEGRGNKIGESLETIDGYLTRLNPQIPPLIEDLRLSVGVADTYSDVLPEIADTLDNTIITTGTLEGREAKLNALLNDVTGLSNTAERFLDNNGDNLVQLAELSEPTLTTLARYAPEFPCLTQGITKLQPRLAEAFRGFTLHIVLETIPNQPRPYTAADRPRLGEDRGPGCVHLPNPPGTQDNPLSRTPDINDGVDEPTNKGTQRVAPASLGYRGTPEDQEMLKQFLGTRKNMTDSDLAVLLTGPIVGGGS